MPKRTRSPAHVTLARAADQLGVSVDTVRRLVRQGELRAVDMSTGKVPRWYIDDAELDRFINRRTLS